MDTVLPTNNSTRIVRCVEDLIKELSEAEYLLKIQNNLAGWPKRDKIIVVDDEISFNDFVVALHHLSEFTVQLGVIDCATINSKSGHYRSDLPADHHTPFDCFVLNAITEMAGHSETTSINRSLEHYRNTEKMHGEERFTGINLINIASKCLRDSTGKKYAILPIINVDSSLMDNFFNECEYYTGIIPVLLLKQADFSYSNPDFYPYLDAKGEEVGVSLDKCKTFPFNHIVTPHQPAHKTTLRRKS